MVRDPSIVSPSLTGVFIGLTGVFIGGGHNKHGIQDRGARTTHHAAEGPQRVDRAVSSPLSIVSLGDDGGDGGVTDRATRGACSARARSRVGRAVPHSLPQWVSFIQISLPSRLHASAHVESNHGRDGIFLLPSKRQRPASGLFCSRRSPDWLIVKIPVVCTYVLIAYWEKRERGLCSLGP